MHAPRCAVVTGTSVSLCHRCRERNLLQDPPLILFGASKETLHTPEGGRDSRDGESIRVAPKGLKRRSSLAGLASRRHHATCQVAVGIVWFLPLFLSSLLREDTFKVTVPLRGPSSPQSLCLLALKATRIRPGPFKPACRAVRRETNAHCPSVCLVTHTAVGLFFQKEI